ncbi:MAG: DnaD domain protein [Clostridia bacterium]|nr:DnaD domain protein [Clostridia bacterium]MBQ5833623.1 DnaD domain protein [Clostridia bacterium]
MKFNYQQEVLVIPASVLTSGADATQLRVLLWLASDTALLRKTRQLAKLADCDAEDAKAAIAFWQAAGVITGEDGEEAIPAMASANAPTSAQEASREAEKTEEKRTHLRRADELPAYTSEELGDLLESRASLRVLVDEAQRTMGKMFNTMEMNILVGMLDYLGMQEESVLLLLAHCVRIGKDSMRAVERYAISLVDRGIKEPAALEEEIRIQEALHSFEGEVRKLFGIGKRALTTREKKLLRAWTDLGFGIEAVRLAYEVTVDATREPSFPYANAILERWNAEGLHTEEEIRRSLEKPKKSAKEPTLGNSFDTDDFFEAALKRSFAKDALQKGSD